MRYAAISVLCVVLHSTVPALGAQQLAAEGSTPGQSIQIRDLVRDEAGNLTLRFTLINDSTRGISGVMLREKPSDSARKPSGVLLVDEATQTEYRPQRGADGQCVCSDMPNTGHGERANLWVKFDQVPRTVTRATIEVKSFEPVHNVPVTSP
jgi:hypothetical protein